MARHAPDYAIMKRRAEEDRIAGHVAAARDKNKAMVMAHFEQRTGARIERRAADARVRKAKASLDADLDRRRRKLAQLLEDEQEQYEREVEATFETPEQRKQRLFARAKELRAKREAARKEEVARRNFERLRAGTDDLRKMDSDHLLLTATRERAAQLAEAEEKARRDREEDERMAIEWERLRQEKIAREEREAREAAERNREMVEALEGQVGLLKEMTAEERAKEAEDAARMLRAWSEEEKAEKAREAAKVEAERIERLKVRQDNEVTARQRALEAGKEFNEDMARLQATLDREAGEEAAEKAAAERRRLEAIEHRRRLEEQMAVEKEEQGELDKLYAEEQEREWRKREMQWEAEAAARERLMKDVDASRREHIAKVEEDARRAREEDKVRASRTKEEIAAEDARLAAEAARVKAKNLQHQKELFNQMRLREEAAAKEAQATYLEGRLMARAEEGYQKQLAAMKAAGAPEPNHRRKTAHWYD